MQDVFTPLRRNDNGDMTPAPMSQNKLLPGNKTARATMDFNTSLKYLMKKKPSKRKSNSRGTKSPMQENSDQHASVTSIQEINFSGPLQNQIRNSFQVPL